MTYNVLMGTLNPTHSLTHSLTHENLLWTKLSNLPTVVMKAKMTPAAEEVKKAAITAEASSQTER